MKPFYKPAVLLLPLLLLLVVYPFKTTVAQQALVSLTPTYDPLDEPPLPEDPTEYELGRNLYWHWCMTCHGDRGQGLTDEFRSIWEEDHQNCWGRGCHAGHPGDVGFPIPTVVPGLVSGSQLAQFGSMHELSEFLKATHPPQSPGILKDEEYHAIALFVFAINERSLTNFIDLDTPAPSVTVTPVPPQETAPNSFSIYATVIFILLAAGVFLIARRPHLQTKKDSQA